VIKITENCYEEHVIEENCMINSCHWQWLST